MTVAAIFNSHERAGVAIAALSPSDDESLGVAAAAGDVAAFETLARRYQVPLLRFLSRFAHRVQDAEDALQETFCRLYAGRAAYRKRWRYRTWAFTIARRTAIDLHRTRTRHESVGTVDASSVSARAIIDEADAAELWTLVGRTVSRESAEALWLCYVECMPAAEIARVLGRTSISVKTLLFRARRDLKRAITKSDGGER